MKKILLAGLFSFAVLILFSTVAHAEIRFEPDMLLCPSTPVGEAVDCGSFSLKNSNFLLSVNVQDITIGDTTNFILDSSACKGKTLSAGSSCQVTVTFLAGTGGDFYTNANAKYTYTGFSKVRSVSAMVHGSATFPIVRLSTHTVPFGDQTTGTTHCQYVTMENIGTGTLNISGMTLPFGSAFSVTDDCRGALPSLDSCELTICFSPTQAIEYASTLNIEDDAHDSPQQIRLSGTGIASGQPDVNISKTSVDFGSLTLGSEAETIVTLTSTGTVNLTITSVIAPPAPFSRTTDCVGVLAPDDRCAITIKFQPVAVGAFTATITINDDATDSPQTIQLKGKGISPNATLDPSLLNFRNQTIGKTSLRQTVMLLNSGTSDLTITEITTSSEIFTQSNSCTATLKPKKICHINVLFSPTETGSFSGWLTVTTNDPSSPSKVLLMGNGITGPDVDISPVMFDFGDTPVGQTSEQKDFLIKNTGEGSLDISTITVNSDFVQSNECPSTLSEEQTCVVETEFIPEAAGNFSGILSIFDNAEGSPHKATLIGRGTVSDITLLPASVNFGNQTAGRPSLTQQIRLLNSGNEALTISSITSSETAFAQTNDCGASLAPSAYCTISVIFTPEDIEEYDGRIEIADSAAGSPHYVSLTGAGIDPTYPDLDVTPNFWDFGQVLVGQVSYVKEFTVKNTGLVDATISDIYANSEFEQVHNCPETLASDATCTISGTFVPEASGNFTGYITVIDNTYDRYQSVMLIGTGSHSGDIDINFSVSNIDFGSVAPMTESEVRSVIITSSGTDPVTIGAIKLAGSEAVDFNMNTNCSSRSLDVGKSCIIDIIFKPTSSGLKTADIVIYDDAHDSPQPIFLSGTGTSGGGGCSLSQHNAKGSAITFGAMIALAALAIFTSRRRRVNSGDTILIS
jgi:hypothetical protein